MKNIWGFKVYEWIHLFPSNLWMKTPKLMKTELFKKKLGNLKNENKINIKCGRFILMLNLPKLRKV
jgi:hypothetical protein